MSWPSPALHTKKEVHRPEITCSSRALVAFQAHHSYHRLRALYWMRNDEVSDLLKIQIHVWDRLKSARKRVGLCFVICRWTELCLGQRSTLFQFLQRFVWGCNFWRLFCLLLIESPLLELWDLWAEPQPIHFVSWGFCWRCLSLMSLETWVILDTLWSLI